MSKIKNIEFLRVIGCIAIILLHMFNNAALHKFFADIHLYDKLWLMTKNGQKAVDLFFVISGFFFAYKFNLNETAWEFLKKKFIRLYPVLIFGIILSLLISLTKVFEFTFYDNILNLLCLNGTSLVLDVGNMGQFWYVSAMLWTFALFLYLLKNYEKKNVNLAIALIVLFCYGFMIHAKNGAINSHVQTFYYIFNVGIMRALGGIGVGYFISEWYKNNLNKINKLALSLNYKVIITILEFICLYFIINNLMLHKINYKNHIIFIITYIAIIILFLLKQGFISKILNSDIWVNLSRYTYSFYMTHLLVINTLKGSLWKYHPEWVYANPIENIVYTLLLVFMLGIFTYHFVEKPCADYFKRAESLARVERERERVIPLLANLRVA